MKFGHSVEIERPVEEVFAVAGNPDNDPQWGALVIKSRRISSGLLGTGTAFEQTVTLLGARFVAVIEVTTYELNRILCLKTDAPIRLRHSRRFEPLPGGTKLTFVVEVDTDSSFKLALSLISRVGQGRMEADLESLKNFLEARNRAPHGCTVRPA